MTYLALEAGLTTKWPLIEFRRLATIRRETNSESSEDLLALSAHTGVRRRPEDGGNQLPSDETITKYWVAYPGDLVFNPMWALEGGVAVSEIRGALSTAYRVYKLGPRLHPRFVHYFLRSSIAIEQYNLLVRGVTTFDRAVKREDFEPMPIPAPPLKDQRRIADFLDKETKRIDKLTERQSELRKLLAEKRYAIIESHLGQGASISDYLAERTSAAYSTPLKHFLVRTIPGGTPDSNSDAYWTDSDTLGTPWISIGDMVENGVVEHTERQLSSLGLAYSKLQVGPAGTLLFAMYASLGKVSYTSGPAVWNQAILGLVPKPDRLDTEFLRLWLSALKPHLGVLARSTTQDNLNAQQVGQLPVPTLSLSQQREAVEHFSGKLKRIDLLDLALSRRADLLRERRQALITAAVTGQLEI